MILETKLMHKHLKYKQHKINVTLSVKTCIVRTSMHFEKKKRNLKIICEITHSAGKYLQRLMGPAISEGSFKSTKLYTI